MKAKQVNELILEIVDIDLSITWINRNILNPDRALSILSLIKEERHLKILKEGLKNRLIKHENAEIGMAAIGSYNMSIANKNLQYFG